MVKLRRFRWPEAYDRIQAAEFNDRVADAIDELEARKSERYNVRRFTGEAITVYPWDLIVFTVSGSIELPKPTAQNAGTRVAVIPKTGATAVVSVVGGTINGAASFGFVTANRLRDIVCSGEGWYTHA